MQDEYKKYNSFGSYRGFYTFAEPSILKVARRKNEIARNKALQTLKRATPFEIWMNHILYRYPAAGTTCEKVGLRVNFHENNFYKNTTG